MKSKRSTISVDVPYRLILGPFLIFDYSNDLPSLVEGIAHDIGDSTTAQM